MRTRTKRCSSCGIERDVACFIDGYGKETRTCVKCRSRKHRGEKPYTGVRDTKEKTITCRRCGEEKPIAAFLPGFDHCRECQRERRAEL